MAILRSLLLALTVAGCYDPSLRDCTVSCTGSDACSDGQACIGGMCVAEGSPADVCMSMMVAPDASTPPPGDEVPLRVKINGDGNGDQGEVVVDDEPGKHCTNDCTYQVAKGQPHMIVAKPAPGHKFQGWTDACAGLVPTCIVTPTSSDTTTVTAKLK